MTPKLILARALAERGFLVFPLKAGAKFPPLIKNWPARAAINFAEIDSWWAKWPDANVGIHCAGFVVLDVDVRANGDDTLAQLDMVHGLPPTLTTRTPTGGRHLFYRLPADHPGVANGANKLGPGIDIKSTNGYVVAPGSEVEAGRYRFEADVPIADAPEWLVQKLDAFTPREQKEYVNVADAPHDVVDRAQEWLAKQPVGDGAFKTACGLRDFGLSQDQATDLLWAHDGRSHGVIQDKVEHAYRYAQNDAGSKAASAEDFPVVEVVAAPKRERSKPQLIGDLAKLPTSTTGYLVKGLLQRRSHAVGYGSPGAGKTFVFLDLAYHVAAGKAWHGHRVHQGPVLYLAYEGIGGMAKRAAALLRQQGNAEVPLFIQGADYNLRDPAGRKALGEDIAQLPAKPVLIVIDTLARAMKGGDENSAQDMGALNDAVTALIESTGACVLLVHHSGKNKASGARGSSALLGAIDTELEVDNHQVYSRKQRDIELAEPFAFKLMPVVIGLDEDGEEVTSCVIEPAVYVAPTSLDSLTENQRLGWDALCALAPDNQPTNVAAWRRACLEFLPEADASARKAFVRLKAGLVKKGLIEETNGAVLRRMT